MKIQRIDESYSEQMCDLFRADQFSLSSDFFIDRGQSFYDCYRWYETEKLYSWGAFNGDQLVAMTSLVRLPLYFDLNKTEIYLNTDFYVHPEYRKSLAAGRLLKALQIELPHSNIFEIGVEQEPGFLDQLPRYSKNFNHETIWLKETNLLQVYPFKKLQDVPISIFFSAEGKIIDSYFQKYLSEFNDSALIGTKEVFQISKAPGVRYFSLSTQNGLIEGLFFDKSNVQKIRWNGRPRLNIEKYKRAHNIGFLVGDEFKIFNLGFISPVGLNSNSHQILWDSFNAFAFQQKYFSWSIRDFDFNGIESHGIETVAFKRRIPFTGQNLNQLNAIKSQNCDLKRIILESVFI